MFLLSNAIYTIPILPIVTEKKNFWDHKFIRLEIKKDYGYVLVQIKYLSIKIRKFKELNCTSQSTEVEHH